MRKPNTSLIRYKEAPARTAHRVSGDAPCAPAGLLAQRHRILSNTGVRAAWTSQAMHH